MPPHRSVRRRRRRRRHELSRPPCAEDQAASSIVATSLSGLQSQGTIHVAPPSFFVVSRVWSRLDWDWGYTFYIRLELQGYFHTYPGLDGPYRSLQEADEAMDRHLDKLRDPKIFMMRDGETSFDVGIRQQIYWPDGTVKRSRQSSMRRMNDHMRRLVQALADKYNEDHHLSGDLAYELKDVLSHNLIGEHNSLYHHINFSTNSKATGDSESSTSDIFFAEVKYLKSPGKHSEVFVCCLCRVDPVGKGQHCNACSIHGGDIMHPDSSVELASGYLDPRCQFGGPMDVRERPLNQTEDPVEQEAELRRRYKGLDDPSFIASLFTLPPGVTNVRG